MTNKEFKKIRIEKGYTQKELGTFLDITVEHISRMETGKHEIRRVVALAMKSLPKK